MDYFLIVVFAGWCALTISGLSLELEARRNIKKALGRKVKYHDLTSGQKFIVSLIALPMYLIFVWWFIAFKHLQAGSGIQKVLLEEYIKILKKNNTLSPEDNQKLNALLTTENQQS